MHASLQLDLMNRIESRTHTRTYEMPPYPREIVGEIQVNRAIDTKSRFRPKFCSKFQ
jgi:hypothetical protein